MYAFTTSISLGEGMEGLTLKAQLLDTAGAPVGDPIETGFFEMAGGMYGWYHQFDESFRGFIQILNAATGELLAVTAFNPEELAGQSPSQEIQAEHIEIEHTFIALEHS